MFNYTKKEKELLKKIIILNDAFSYKQDKEAKEFDATLYEKVEALGYLRKKTSALINDAVEIGYDNKARQELFNE